MNVQTETEKFFSFLGKYPYLSAFLVCIGLNPFFFGADINIPNNMLWLTTFIMAGIFAVFLYKRHDRLAVIYAVLSGIFWVIGSILYTQSEHPALWHFFGGVILLALYYYFSDGKSSEKKTSLLIMGTGFFLKLYYVLETSVYTRQHDVEYFGEWDGHAGYITYLIDNHHLCDTDVTEHWQFAHPPLHHILGALWIEINEKIFHTGYDPARESLQMLTLFYSMCVMILSYKILKYFKLKGNLLYIALGIINFHPAFILFSGSINNDILALVFIMGAVLNALKWYQNPDLWQIMKLAVCIGLGMMTKLSAGIIAPPTALLFLIIFIKKCKTDWKELLKQFLCFSGVCVPLGLWYPVRSWLKWDIPVLYVHEIDEGELQYITDKNFWERITDFSLYQFQNPYEQWLWQDETGALQNYNEFNPLTALLKTSLFGEGLNESLFGGTSFVNYISVIFFWVNVLIAGTALISMLAMLFVKTSMKAGEKLFFLSFYLCMMGNFYSMSEKYPLVCTMNFRYITPTVIIGTLFLTLMLKKFKKPVHITASILTASFVLCSMIIYLTAGYCTIE